MLKSRRVCLAFELKEVYYSFLSMVSLPPALDVDYTFVRRLGSGNFGSVLLYTRKEGKIDVAVKLLERGDRINKDVIREVLNHRLLDHVNIIKFIELRLTQTHLAIVMEYAQGGELFSKLVENKAGAFKEDEARWYTQQLVAGLWHMHSRGVAHRDIKLENLVLDGSNKRILKICDLGYSKQLALSQAKTKVGTASYLAPEVVHDTNYDAFSCDVWATGVCLHVMLARAYPFNDPRHQNDDRVTVRNLVKYYAGELQYNPPNVSKSCQELLFRLLSPRHQNRIRLEEVALHPWFTTEIKDNYFGGMVVEAAQRGSMPDGWGTIQTEEQTRKILEKAAAGPDTGPEDILLEDPNMMDSTIYDDSEDNF